MTLKTLYEKKATSLCGNRDQNFLEKVAETRQTAARVPFSTSYTDVDVMEVELEFKRQSSHGPLNYYLTKADQINRNQKIQISMIDIYEAEEKVKRNQKDL